MIGYVVIGRNEGERLIGCFKSLIDAGVNPEWVVYVDSGSTDGSVAVAEENDFRTHLLDTSAPFTAARARNAGFSDLNDAYGEGLQYVQFLDGDCLLADAWVKRAIEFIEDKPDVAIVCGQRSELHPAASVYNQLCDWEWNTPIGAARHCGGDFLVRAAVFLEVEGFNPKLIAGEEPELCVRLRRAGWQVFRIDANMTYHDAAITDFKSWAKRCIRGGYAFALGASIHGATKERHFVRETARATLWGLAFPILSLLLIAISPKMVSFVAGLLAAKLIWTYLRAPCPTGEHSWVYASSLLISNVLEGIGVAKFAVDSLLNNDSEIIEYK
ncbi:MAG: glycosyltransferase family A protein [Pseudomonadota bacterium]